MDLLGQHIGTPGSHSLAQGPPVRRRLSRLWLRGTGRLQLWARTVAAASGSAAIKSSTTLSWAITSLIADFARGFGAGLRRQGRCPAGVASSQAATTVRYASAGDTFGMHW